MKEKSIGIFDSGIGGLTVAHAISKTLPNEQLIYFGDTAHLPYGDKSKQAVAQYSHGITNFLLKQNCKAIVIACNTASAAAYESLRAVIDPAIPIINVIDPMIKAVVATDIQKIGLIGTKGTVDSGIYPLKLIEAKPSLEVCSLATRSLVPIIEEGLHHDQHLLYYILDHYFHESDFEKIEGLILGCTHYPLIKDSIRRYFKGKVEVFDTPEVIAQYLQQSLNQLDLRSSERSGPDTFYVSDFTTSFEKTTRLFFKAEIELKHYPLWD